MLPVVVAAAQVLQLLPLPDGELVRPLLVKWQF